MAERIEIDTVDEVTEIAKAARREGITIHAYEADALLRLAKEVRQIREQLAAAEQRAETAERDRDEARRMADTLIGGYPNGDRVYRRHEQWFGVNPQGRHCGFASRYDAVLYAAGWQEQAGEGEQK